MIKLILLLLIVIAVLAYLLNRRGATFDKKGDNPYQGRSAEEHRITGNGPTGGMGPGA